MNSQNSTTILRRKVPSLNRGSQSSTQGKVGHIQDSNIRQESVNTGMRIQRTFVRGSKTLKSMLHQIASQKKTL